jgi:uncharacterized YigZ family protein
MQGDTYKTIEGQAESVFKEKGSKFLAFAHPVSSVEEVKTLLEVYRKTYYDARHVCYAYLLGPTGEDYRANDDGEPSGTAGKPILGQIQSFGLTNVLVVVVRYFGGVLLGTGGLVVAYKSAANGALGKATVLEKTIDVEFHLRFEFPFMDTVLRIVRKLDARIISQHYETDCLMCVRIRKNESERLKEALEKVETLRFENL